MGGVSGERYEEQRARNFERARRSGVPDSVAQLFAVVQEPRCDDEGSSPAFEVTLKQEVARLRDRISNPPSDQSTLSDSNGLGGLLETEATTSARCLLVAAEADG